MKDLMIEIGELLDRGHSPQYIADTLGVPIEWVIPNDMFEPIEYDPFLTDAEADADALASVGWGTDEDYGYYGDE